MIRNFKNKIYKNPYKDTQKIYGHIATIERDTRHKIKRQEVRENIKAIIEKVVGNEVK